MTPEGKVKKIVKELLDAYGAWWTMPIGGPYSQRGVPDFLCCYKGRMFAIETKAPGKKPTKLQLAQMAAITKAGGTTFVVDDGASLMKVKGWLDGQA